MIFDLLDYVFGEIKGILYFILYLGRYRYNLYSKISRAAHIRIYNKGKIKIGRNVVVRSGCTLRVHESGTIIIGKNSGLNNNCFITSFDCIEIGENTIIGQGVMIYDHDHIYKGVDHIKGSGFKKATVKIGNNVWIGSDCVILKGTIIGDNTVVAAGSIVSGIIPSNVLYVQKRNSTIIEL